VSQRKPTSHIGDPDSEQATPTNLIILSILYQTTVYTAFTHNNLDSLWDYWVSGHFSLSGILKNMWDPLESTNLNHYSYIETVCVVWSRQQEEPSASYLLHAGFLLVSFLDHEDAIFLQDVDFQWTTWHYIPDDIILLGCFCMPLLF
jgi:hypothetical protein